MLSKSCGRFSGQPRSLRMGWSGEGLSPSSRAIPGSKTPGGGDPEVAERRTSPGFAASPCGIFAMTSWLGSAGRSPSAGPTSAANRFPGADSTFSRPCVGFPGRSGRSNFETNYLYWVCIICQPRSNPPRLAGGARPHRAAGAARAQSASNSASVANDFCAPRLVTSPPRSASPCRAPPRDRETGGEIAGEAADEGVAGPGRRRSPRTFTGAMRFEPPGGVATSAPRAPSVTITVPTPSAIRQFAAACDLVLRLDRQTGQNGELAFVRRDEAREPQLVAIERAERGAGLSTVFTPCRLPNSSVA